MRALLKVIFPGIQWRKFCLFQSSFPRAGKLRTMKVDLPEFHEVFTPELKQLIEVFRKYNHELRIAGGAVRDMLMRNKPHDIDFATTAMPNQMKEMFEAEGIRIINNRGEKHGTVTARLNDKENFEVTTLRIDVKTDGRHAEVEFTTDWQLDANRRDLTFNAMFLGFDGTLYDYFHGKEDLEQKLVRFVGDPVSRIQEDYLRILRYFRFYGKISPGPNNHQAKTLEAIQCSAHGLEGISGERIWMELKKIVCGNYAADIIATMVNLGLGPYIGLPESPNVQECKKISMRCCNLSPQPMTIMASLLSSDDDVLQLKHRLKISNEEAKLGLFLIGQRDEMTGDRPLKHYQSMLIDSKEKKAMKIHVLELLKYQGEERLHQDFSVWNLPRFPVTGYDLLERKVPKGPLFAKTLKELQRLWKESDYTLTKETLLSKIEQFVK